VSTAVERPRVLVFTGSVRMPSYTRALSREVCRVLTSLGADVVDWDLGELALPMADPEYHRSASEHPDSWVVKLDSEARIADAFVLATPVYHNSYSGVLKNALDLLNIDPHFRAKPVGLISHGGDRSPQAVDHLRIVVRGLNAIATPTQVCTQRTDFEAHGHEYRLANRDILQRICRFSEELAAYAVVQRTLRNSKAVRGLLARIAREEN
jgi:azobenzene reductase